ncbi:MAG TPA: cell division protein FtsQ/DivIB [Acetobacteraceae bacterium]|nr:cell division protein FtsQ/DivIB [Acetobacteraceae bacterium]
MPRVKSRKSPKIQDRLSARAMFVRRLRRGLKPAAMVAAVLLALVIVPALWSGAVGAATGPIRRGADAAVARLGFRVEHIRIEGATTTPASLVRSALGVDYGAPILGVPIAEAAERIESLGPVKRAVVQRVLPATLVIHVTERSPFAIWQGPDRRFVLIDRQGNVMLDHDAAAAKARDPSLLLLVGNEAPAHAAALIDRLAHYPAISRRIVAAQRVDDLRWNLILKDHAMVKLPAQHVGAALAELMSVQERIAILDRPVKVIDLRLADRLVVRPYPAGFMAGADQADENQPKTNPKPDHH